MGYYEYFDSVNELLARYPKHYRSTQVDSFGNRCIYGAAIEFHDHFSVDVTGEAEVSSCGLTSGQTGIFKYATNLTRAGENIRKFYAGLGNSDHAGNFERAMYMMNALYEKFSYMSGITGVNTTAEEAFTLGQGVCQDYAHILLALCRLEKIPCRYVVGMIPGEGATHA